MKVIKIAFLILFSINNLFSQSIGVQLDRNQGVIESIFIKKENIVFELDSANSGIKNIYFFSEDSLSERFFYDPVRIAIKKIVSNLKTGGKIILCGNGGSAADAQHLAAEFLVRLRPNFNRSPLPALTLATDTSTITACGNDYKFSEIFSRNLEALGKKSDISQNPTRIGSNL